MNELQSFFRQNHLAFAGAVILAIMTLAVLIGPFFLGSPLEIEMGVKLQAPSLAYPLGTDNFGRDILSRVLTGGRFTLAIGIFVVVLAFVIGVFFGILAGFTGGMVDTIIMRVADAILSFPALVLAIALAAAFGPSLQNAMLAVAITMAPQFARVARSQALAISARPYVNAAQSLGLPKARILVHYILLNSIRTIACAGQPERRQRDPANVCLGISGSWRAASDAGMGGGCVRQSGLRAVQPLDDLRTRLRNPF